MTGETVFVEAGNIDVSFDKQTTELLEKLVRTQEQQNQILMEILGHIKRS